MLRIEVASVLKTQEEVLIINANKKNVCNVNVDIHALLNISERPIP